MKTRPAVIGVLAVLALGTVATTGTYAWLNTQSETAPQRIDAGTLHLVVGTPSDPVPADNMQPGEHRRLAVVSVTNTGSLDGALAFETLDVSDSASPSGTPVPGPQPGSFSSHLRVDVTEDTPTGTVTLVNSVPLAALSTHDLGALTASGTPGSTRVLTVWIDVDTSAGNEIEGSRTTFRLLAMLRQAA